MRRETVRVISYTTRHREPKAWRSIPTGWIASPLARNDVISCVVGVMR